VNVAFEQLYRGGVRHADYFGILSIALVPYHFFLLPSLIDLAMERTIPEGAPPRRRRSRGFVTQNVCNECRRRRAKVFIQFILNWKFAGMSAV
jgi:hypothetical protein